MSQAPRRKAGSSSRPKATPTTAPKPPSSPTPTGKTTKPTKASDTAPKVVKEVKQKAKKPEPTTGDPNSAPRPHAPRRAKVDTRPKPEWPITYLEVLALTGNKTKAAAKAKVNIKTVWERRQLDAKFAQDEKLAMDIAKDVVMAEITRRAMEGVREIRRDPKSGIVIQNRTVYSDTLLLALARYHETGTWRDNPKIEHGGALGIGVMTRAERMAKLAEAERAGKEPL